MLSTSCSWFLQVKKDAPSCPNPSLRRWGRSCPEIPEASLSRTFSHSHSHTYRRARARERAFSHTQTYGTRASGRAYLCPLSSLLASTAISSNAASCNTLPFPLSHGSRLADPDLQPPPAASPNEARRCWGLKSSPSPRLKNLPVDGTKMA